MNKYVELARGNMILDVVNNCVGTVLCTTKSINEQASFVVYECHEEGYKIARTVPRSAVVLAN